VAHGLDEGSELVVWVRAVATALLAGVIAKIILFPPGGLADVRSWFGSWPWRSDSPPSCWCAARSWRAYWPGGGAGPGRVLVGRLIEMSRHPRPVRLAALVAPVPLVPQCTIFDTGSAASNGRHRDPHLCHKWQY